MSARTKTTKSRVSRTLAVVKVGGDILLDARQSAGLAQNVRALIDAGVVVIVVHGGGPQATALAEKCGLPVRKVAGQRVTSKDDLVVVTQAVCGEVNTQLVALLLGAGVCAFGCHGASGALLQAKKRPPVVVDHTAVDYGHVGDIVSVDAKLLRNILRLGVVPVIATLAVDTTKQTRTRAQPAQLLNVNADAAASHIAQALAADVVFLASAIGGVRKHIDDPKSRVARIDRKIADKLTAQGTIAGGMIPKVEEALALVDAGVGTVAIVDAAQKNSFLSCWRGKGSMGTRFVR